MNETMNPHLNWLNSEEFENSKPYGLPMNAPLELCDANGNTRMTIPPQSTQQYYQQPINNYPQYQAPVSNPYCNQQPQYYPPQAGYGYNMQYAPTPEYGIRGMYPQTNNYYQMIDSNDLCYQKNPSSGVTLIEFRTGIIRTRKNELEGIKPELTYRDPRTEYLERMQEYRRNYTGLMVKLYKAYCVYNNREFNEEEAIKRFDPFPDPPKPIDFATATPEEKKKYLRNQQVEKGKMLAAMFAQHQIMEERAEVLRKQAFQRIFESHDKLIGYDRNSSKKYTLKDYLDNAGALRVDALLTNARKARRNGTRLFSPNEFRARLSQDCGKPVPIDNLEDEYVSVKERLEQMRKKKAEGGQQYELCVYRTPDGKTSYVKEPVFDTEFERHMYFLEAVQAMKDEDDLMRAGR